MTTTLPEDVRRNLLGWSGQATVGSQAVSGRELAADPGSRQRIQVTLSVYRRFGKRALDLALGAVLFVGLLPVLAVVAVAVLVTHGWPVLYLAERIGKDGRLFRMWKFRTMVRDADQIFQRWRTEHPHLAAEYEREFKLKDDPRVTKLGRFLRGSSIDELPQLWNVLRGEMSLVGPRPVTQTEVRRYGPHANTLLSLRPGMTGRWQVNGRNEVSYPERMWRELDYCRSADLLGDARILLRSLVVPFRYNGR